MTRNLSDLELLEVFNAVGADLLKQTMEDQAETGVVDRNVLNAMLEAEEAPVNPEFVKSFEEFVNMNHSALKRLKDEPDK